MEISSPTTSHLIILKMFMPEISNRMDFANGKYPCRSPAARKEKDAINYAGDFGQWRSLNEALSRHKGA